MAVTLIAHPNPWEVSNLECFLFYCCPECEFRCQAADSFEQHAGSAHPGSSRSIVRMREAVGMANRAKGHHFCKLCGKYFTAAHRWANHMAHVHWDTKPFKCPDCDSGFTQQADVQRHIKQVHRRLKAHHSPETIPQPDGTGRPGLRGGDHDRVLATQAHLDSRLQCQPCKAVFFSHSHLSRHNQRVHHIVPLHTCDICQKRLGTRNDLKRHIQSVHQKKKPFLCVLCKVSFSRKSYCKAHLKAVHHQEDELCDGQIIDVFAADDSEVGEVERDVSLTGTSINVEDIDDFQKAPLKCLTCKAIFLDAEALERHPRLAHASDQDRVQVCHHCSKTYATVNELKRHTHEVHDKKTLFECSICRTSFARKYICRDHISRQHGSNDASLILCRSGKDETPASMDAMSEGSTAGGRQLPDIEAKDVIPAAVAATASRSGGPPDQSLPRRVGTDAGAGVEEHWSESNIATHEIPKPRVDLFQGVDSNGQLGHVDPHMTEPEERQFECTKCDDFFASRFELGQHIRVVHRDAKCFPCDRCDYSAATHQNLATHVQAVHERIRKFKCPHCESSFSQRSHWRVHIRTVHEKLRPFVCEKCGKAFSQRSRLSNHDEILHPKPASCTVCRENFGSKVSLYRHHTSSHPNVPIPPELDQLQLCEICNTPFLTRVALRRHHRMRHKDSNAAKPKPKEAHPCQPCGKIFHSKPRLSNHTKVVHEKVKAFVCHVCSKSFGYKKSLANHVAVIHEDNGLHACNVCDKKFGM